LKVFHLQELSSGTLKDFELAKDPRYSVLKAQIFSREGMKQLSPSQMVAACVSLGRIQSKNIKEWTVMCNALKGNCDSENYEMTPTQIAACLFWIAKSGFSVCVKDRLIQTAFKKLLSKSNDWSAVDIGWVLYFMKKKISGRNLPIWQRTLSQLVYRFNERISSMTPKNIVCIISELSGIKILPGKAIHRALRICEMNANNLDWRTILTLLRSMGSLEIFEPRLVHVLAEHIPKKTEPGLRQAAQFVYCFARLDFFHSGIIRWSFENLNEESRIGKLSDIDIAHAAYGFGRLGIASCKREWEVISKHVLSNLDRLSPLHFAMIVNAFGQVGLRDSDTMGPIAGHFRSNMAAFTERQVVSILASLANCGITFQDILISSSAVNKYNEFRINKLSPSMDLPVMEELSRRGIHSQIEEYLESAGVTNLLICPKLGKVWADARFERNGEFFALLFLKDCDVCKLDKQVLLGPALWRKDHIESQGFKALTVHVQGNKLPQLSLFRTLMQANVAGSGRPFHYNRRSNKVSFR
jgi:hypothetical protein